MSVQQELIDLRIRKETIKRNFNDINNILKNFLSTQATLSKKLEAFNARTSSLATTLAAKTQEELDAVNEEVAKAQKAKSELEKDLEETNKKISEREDTPDLYIEEQANSMVCAFLEYVNSNLEKIGNEIKKTYFVSGSVDLHSDRYGDYYVPTGYVDIDEDTLGKTIISSYDFYFNNPLYTCERDSYDHMIVHETEWYKEYLNKFTLAILNTLKAEFNCKFFALTIDGSSFTLELV